MVFFTVKRCPKSATIAFLWQLHLLVSLLAVSSGMVNVSDTGTQVLPFPHHAPQGSRDAIPWRELLQSMGVHSPLTHSPRLSGTGAASRGREGWAV